MRDGFIIHEKTLEQIALLTDEEAGQLLRAMAAHYRGEDRPEVERIVESVLITAEDRMDADEGFYENKRTNGKKGAAKRWQDDSNAIANVCQSDGKDMATAWQDDSNAMPSDSVSDSDSEKKKKKREGRFTPPTLSQIKEYCQQRQREGHPAVNPEKFLDYYEANGWKVGRNPMKDWKAAVRNWEQREKSPPEKPPKSAYFNVTQRQYDYAALEKKILGG